MRVGINLLVPSGEWGKCNPYIQYFLIHYYAPVPETWDLVVSGLAWYKP